LKISDEELLSIIEDATLALGQSVLQKASMTALS
jgi:hypothetical protein